MDNKRLRELAGIQLNEGTSLRHESSQIMLGGGEKELLKQIITDWMRLQKNSPNPVGANTIALAKDLLKRI